MADNEDTKEIVLETPSEASENNNEELKIEVSDEKEASHELKKEAIEPEEGITELKKRLEIERLARQEAERRAHEASKQAKKASSETKDANYQLVVNAIETIKGRSEALKRAYTEAMNVGDYEKSASIQEALAINANQLSELKKGKKALKQQLENAEKQQEIKPMAPPQGEIVDQLAASVSPRSAAWLKSHRDNIRNERDVRKMFRAHEDAIDDGIEPDTDDYFSYIEQRMGLRSEPAQKEESPLSSASAPVVRKPSPPPSAPVSRGGQRPNVVRLTRDQVEMAKMMGMTEAEYAKNMVALQREGKIGN